MGVRKMALVLGLASVMFTSCEKQLENVLRNDTYDNAFWKSQKDVEGAVNGTYALFRDALTTNYAFFVWGDTPIGKLVSNMGSLHSDIYTGGSFTAPYRETGTHNWTKWYKVVDLANLVLKRVPEMDAASFADGQRDYLMGQAYFMRALSYFYMTRVWGDLPLQLLPTETADDAEWKGRTSTEEIQELIVSDAQKASTLLKWESVEQSGRRFGNKGAALALLTHVTAWQNDYSKTVLYADSIINEGSRYSLLPAENVQQIFKDATAKENIFAFTTKDAEGESAGNNSDVFSNSITFITNSNIVYKGFPWSLPVYFMDETRLNTLYPNADDARKTHYYDYIDNGSVAQDNASNVRRYSLKKYANYVYRNPMTFSDVRSETNYVIFRLADIMLLKAEALNRLNRDGEARTALNLVRSRAKTLDVTALSGSALLEEILKERQRELIGEGHAYFDLVRNIWKKNDITEIGFSLGQLINWNMGGSNLGDNRLAKKGYLFPIHNSILNNNRLITQNAYWMGRY